MRVSRTGLCGGLVCIIVAAASVTCDVERLDVTYLDIERPTVTLAGDVEPDGIAALRVVVGAQSLGFYPAPASVPVLSSGTQTVRVEPVVRRSGDSEDLRVYPLYEPFVRELQMEPGTSQTLSPSFSYVSTAVVAFDEGFETPSSGLIIDLVDSGSAPLSQNTQDVRAGGASGAIALTADAPVYEVTSPLIVPDRAQLLDLWIELDYRGDVPLLLALFPETLTALPPGTPRAARYFQGALPREDWKKIYFDIRDQSNDDFIAQGFRVSVLAVYDPERGGVQRVHLDNLRVVYR